MPSAGSNCNCVSVFEQGLRTTCCSVTPIKGVAHIKKKPRESFVFNSCLVFTDGSIVLPRVYGDVENTGLCFVQLEELARSCLNFFGVSETKDIVI